MRHARRRSQHYATPLRFPPPILNCEGLRALAWLRDLWTPLCCASEQTAKPRFLGAISPAASGAPRARGRLQQAGRRGAGPQIGRVETSGGRLVARGSGRHFRSRGLSTDSRMTLALSAPSLYRFMKKRLISSGTSKRSFRSGEIKQTLPLQFSPICQICYFGSGPTSVASIRPQPSRQDPRGAHRSRSWGSTCPLRGPSTSSTRWTTSRRRRRRSRGPPRA